MGFLDKLRMNNVFNPNPLEPLFGGLLSFDQQEPTERKKTRSENMGIFTPRTKERDTGISRGMLAKRDKMLPSIETESGEGGQRRTPTVRFDDTHVAEGRLRLDRDKFRHESGLDFEKLGDERKKMGLEERKFISDEKQEKSKLDLERQKHDVALRKQALDEWQSKNPQGELEVDKDGRIMVINKITGKSIDTGLKSGDLTDEETINKNFRNSKELEEIRRKNRLELEEARAANRNNTVSPTQVRAAEEDAARELLRGKYASVSRNIGFDSNGNLVYKRFGDVEKDKIFEQFDKDMKTLAKGRMNTKRDSTVTTPTVSSPEDTSEMIRVVGPNGETGRMPKGKTLPEGWKEVGK